MPVKLPANLGVVSFHRPDWMKPIAPGAKEGVIAGRPPHLRPRPKTNQPLIQRTPPSPYNNLPSVDKVNAEIERRALFTRQSQVVAAVQAHLARQLPADPQRPVVVLIGELHGTDLALLQTLTTLNRLRGFGSKQVMAEMAPQSMQAGLGSIDGTVAELRQCMDWGSRFDPDQVNAPVDVLMTNCIYARAQGYDVAGFDRHHADGPMGPAPDNDTREDHMLAALGAQRKNAQVTVVVTGNVHLPVLHEAMKADPTVTTIGIATVTPVAQGDHLVASRMSYLLSTPEILTIRPDASLQGAPADITALIRINGLAT